MEKSITKLPRLYTELDIAESVDIALSKDKAHYLKNVMRKSIGDQLRVFNGRDGEWLCDLKDISKKSGVLKPLKTMKAQPNISKRIHGFFPIIKKQRMDFMVEKAVELGVTDLHPVLCEYCDVRKINVERIQAQIIEASEQCERLDIPELHHLKNLKDAIFSFSIDIYAALERFDNQQNFNLKTQNDYGVLVGPEGGFSDNEIVLLKSQDHVIPVSLGNNILRSETAFINLLCKI